MIGTINRYLKTTLNLGYREICEKIKDVKDRISTHIHSEVF